MPSLATYHFVLLSLSGLASGSRGLGVTSDSADNVRSRGVSIGVIAVGGLSERKEADDVFLVSDVVEVLSIEFPNDKN